MRDTGFCFSCFAPLEHSATRLFCFQIVHVRWTACVDQRKFEGVNKEPSK